MKRIINLITYALVTALLIVALSGCQWQKPEQGKAKEAISADNGKIQIVATLFPQYDFARQIAGDKAVITLLLPPGVESHSYEPAPSDIIKIGSADLFIYTGEYMETWAHSILKTVESSEFFVLDASEGIDLVTISEAEEELEENGHEQAGSLENDHLYDPHIWTNPVMAKKMVENILNSLCTIDPDNTDYYKANAEKYIEELEKIDSEFRSIVQNGSRDVIVFGSKFALYYFVKEYGLNYEAAFDSCSKETEPSAKTIAHLIEKIREEKIPVIYYGELTEPKVSKSISDETRAKMLLLHSCHNVTKEEF